MAMDRWRDSKDFKNNSEDKAGFIVKKIQEGWLEPEKILFIAAHHNHRRVFQALWPLIEDKNPQLSLPQPSSTPLHIAAKHGYTKLVGDIIDQDLEEKNPPDEV